MLRKTICPNKKNLLRQMISGPVSGNWSNLMDIGELAALGWVEYDGRACCLTEKGSTEFARLNLEARTRTAGSVEAA